MSYMSLVLFDKDEKQIETIDFRNSHGGAAFIFGKTYDLYFKDKENKYDNWLLADEKKISRFWDLWKNHDIFRPIRAAHLSMMDYAVIEKADFKQYAKDLRDFTQIFLSVDHVCHLDRWAEVFDEMTEDVDFVGFYNNSVNDDLWEDYDFSNQDNHFSVYFNLREWELMEVSGE